MEINRNKSQCVVNSTGAGTKIIQRSQLFPYLVKRLRAVILFSYLLLIVTFIQTQRSNLHVMSQSYIHFYTSPVR